MTQIYWNNIAAEPKTYAIFAFNQILVKWISDNEFSFLLFKVESIDLVFRATQAGFVDLSSQKKFIVDSRKVLLY